MTDRRPAWVVAALTSLIAAASPPESRPWAFRPVVRTEAPQVAGVTHPIDAFLLRALADDGLSPAPEADRRTLIRRVTFDLIGLPPTPEEVARFLADDRTDAFEHLVDDLLARPQYGERWGRHWLDLVRYAETNGYERDGPKPNPWTYRDWVISALNRDLPYDRFLIDQLAGDEVESPTNDSRAATGMYRLGPIDDEPADPVMDRFDQLDDMIKTIGTTMLGLTIHCARCHDHKFDPIKQEDYYRLVAFLAPSQPYVRDRDESLSVVLADEGERDRVKALDEAVTKQVEALKARVRALKAPHAESLQGKEAAAAELALAGLLTPAEKLLKSDLERRVQSLEKSRPVALPAALGLTDTGPISPPTHLMIRGDAHRPGTAVEPGFLAILDEAPPVLDTAPGRKTTGRRLALARWIARGENPLTARVMVNRLWQGHFGRGLVGTPSDFGLMGDEPSHPELLDWLASEFVARGWSLKAMHRLMLTSAAYRRSGRWDDAASAADPRNDRLWRFAPRRLEAEPIRDAILSVSGSLNPAMGGPSIMPEIDPAVLAGQSRPGDGWKATEGPDAWRRSVYVKVKRTLGVPELVLLDAADENEPCPRRAVTTTAPQALTLINGSFMHQQARRFADRLRSDAGDDPGAQVDRAFRLAFGRGPEEGEKADSMTFLAASRERIASRPDPRDRADPDLEALRLFCLVMLNANEFVTVD